MRFEIYSENARESTLAETRYIYYSRECLSATLSSYCINTLGVAIFSFKFPKFNLGVLGSRT
jgi:hypothetical protein